jgi:hypothetical protein
MLAGLVEVALSVAGADLVELLVEDRLVVLASLAGLGFFFGEGLGALEGLELADQGLHSGEEAAVVVPQAGQWRGVVLVEVVGGDRGGRVGVGGVGPVGVGVGGREGGDGFRVELGGEEGAFDLRDLVELPEDQGELFDQRVLGQGPGAPLFAELFEPCLVGGGDA